MVKIPDSWPADDNIEPISVEAPLFPLPGVFLFPGQVLRLHIFEPRYRQMIEDSLDGPGRIAIAAIEGDTSTAGNPPLRDLAGLGEIARHEKLSDGRYLIWLGGIGRVKIEEVDCDRLYRRAKCQIACEIAPTRDQAADLRGPLVEAIATRFESELQLDDDLPIGLLTDLLSQCISMPAALRGDLFEEADITRRAELALDAHANYPETPDDASD